MLKSSLSVVLPVCNAQANLSRRLSSLLDVLPELAGRFEVAIIEHGSSDATAELAHDLAAGYPQIGVMSYPRPLDSSAVLRCGLQATSGDMVLLVSDPAADPHDFHRLTTAAGTADAVAGRLPATSAEGPMRGSRDVSQLPALLLFHRRVATAWRSTQSDETLANYLLRKRYRIAEVLIRQLAELPRAPAKPSVVPPPAMLALRSSRRSHAAGPARHPFGPSFGR